MSSTCSPARPGSTRCTPSLPCSWFSPGATPDGSASTDSCSGAPPGRGAGTSPARARPINRSRQPSPRSSTQLPRRRIASTLAAAGVLRPRSLPVAVGLQSRLPSISLPRWSHAMKALVYHGPNDKSWDDVADAALIDDTDAIVRVDATTICGTDLHILKGDIPEVTPGRILGHEAVGTVEAVGAAVSNLKPGDRVLVSCISACGRCRFCREARFGQCLGGGGWILGHNIDGTQAEKVRVPFADTSTYPIPPGVSDEEFLMLADILPTAYEVGVLNGGVSPGDVVAIVGAGPIGLSAITGALLFSPSHVIAIDLADTRLEAAKQFGADVIVNNSREDPLAVVRGLT